MASKALRIPRPTSAMRLDALSHGEWTSFDPPGDLASGASTAFWVVFQPRVRLATGAVCGARTMIGGRRVVEDDNCCRSLPQPIRSVSAASLERFALRRACDQLMVWRRGDIGHLRVTVALTPTMHGCNRFADMVMATLDERGVTAGRLEIEIDSAVEMLHETGMFPEIRRLRDAGVHVSIDQFALGGPGARLLADMAVDRVRLDRSLIPMIGRSPRHEALLSACVHLARQLGAETVVDAVESPGQAEFLRDIGCDEAQGRLFGIPVPPDDFIDSCAGRPLGEAHGRVPLDLI